MKFPTKEKLRAAKIFNPYGIAHLLPEQVAWIGFSRADNGRGGHGAHFQIMRTDGVLTDPKGAWYNYGHKTFMVFQKSKEDTLANAKAYVEKELGPREWVRDPWGSWHDARVVALACGAVREFSE